MKLQSILEARNSNVPFPTFTGERVYMVPFTKAERLPAYLRRWQPTVDAMLLGIETSEPVYLMVDQSTVKAGATHRRPGLHIDGHWIAGSGHHVSAGWWRHHFDHPEALILASDVAASRAFVGDYDGEIGEGGDCRHISTEGMREVPLLSGIAYAGNVSMLHESIAVKQDCARTVVRLNVPGWSP